MSEKNQSFYGKLIFKCKEKKSRIYLYVISFLESIIFPLPTDIFLVPFVLAKKKKLLENCLNNYNFFSSWWVSIIFHRVSSMGTSQTFFIRVLSIYKTQA